MEVSAEVLSVRQRGEELEWVLVFQVEEDFHPVGAEDRRPSTTVSSG